MPFGFALIMLFSFVAHANMTAKQLEEKLLQRRRIVDLAKRSGLKSISDLSAPAYFLASDLTYIVTDIRSLDRVSTVNSNSMMWTGFFWPNYLGGLAYRLPDPNFPRSNWGQSREYVRARPSAATANEYLSPAEKYDIVMGVSPEEEGSLTNHQWKMGEAEFNRTGLVETWQGICHGWAPAAINLPIPKRSVIFSTHRGNITFTPDDIKALGSLLYANGRYESVHLGLRCNSNTPEVDNNGRIITPECFDINPADWHIITTHHLGFGRRPFVIDIVQSEQVWNKPIIGYRYKYQNLQTGLSTNTINMGIIPIAQARRLRHNSYRNPITAYVIGIEMTITYLDGGFVRNNMNNTKEMSFSYDLELDANYKIIGGEWQSEIRPDFAWKPRFVALPTTEGDTQTSTLKPWEAAVNPAWRNSALQSNAHGAPLTKFVKYLFDIAGAI